MQKKKGIALVLSFALVACLAVAGTLAWLTAQTNVVTNTFTVGKIAATLDEALVNEYGQPIDNADDKNVVAVENAPRVEANSYKLIPGHEYTKDPIVHVAKDSEPCYLFVKVENGLADAEADSHKIFAQMTANGWVEVEGNVWVYNGGNLDDQDGIDGATIVDARGGVVNVPVFQKLTIGQGVDVSQYADANITIVACAVQRDGIDSVADAYAKAVFA